MTESWFWWLEFRGGPWDGRTFYPGGEVVPGRVVVTLPAFSGCYCYSRDGSCLVWEQL